MAETASLHPAENTSSLRAEAPSFTSGQTREVRPTNLRHLRTNPQSSRGLDAALDYIPFTPSQGIITPSPLAAAHYDQQMLLYPFTPQGPPPGSLQQMPGVQNRSIGSKKDGECFKHMQAAGFEDGLPALQSISEEGSGNSGQSFTTFSPFRWPMPVSPSAFPVQQEAYIVAGQGVNPSSGMPSVQGMMPVATHDYLYPMQLPPGSPVYLRSSTPFAPGQSWSGSRRPASRLSGIHASGPIYLTVPTPGSPVYPHGVNPMEFSQALNVGMVYPFSNGSPASSPRWQASGNVPFHVQGPPTPPRNSRFATHSTPFRTFVPSMPTHMEHGRGDKRPEIAAERKPSVGLGSSYLPPSYHADAQVPMNARQRRTARRKAEREAKAQAEERARQEAVAAKGDERTDPAEPSDEDSTLTVPTSQRPEASQPIEAQ